MSNETMERQADGQNAPSVLENLYWALWALQ